MNRQESSLPEHHLYQTFSAEIEQSTECLSLEEEIPSRVFFGFTELDSQTILNRNDESHSSHSDFQLLEEGKESKFIEISFFRSTINDRRSRKKAVYTQENIKHKRQFEDRSNKTIPIKTSVFARKGFSNNPPSNEDNEDEKSRKYNVQKYKMINKNHRYYSNLKLVSNCRGCLHAHLRSLALKFGSTHVWKNPISFAVQDDNFCQTCWEADRLTINQEDCFKFIESIVEEQPTPSNESKLAIIMRNQRLRISRRKSIRTHIMQKRTWYFQKCLYIFGYRYYINRFWFLASKPTRKSARSKTTRRNQSKIKQQALEGSVETQDSCQILSSDAIVSENSE